MSKIGRKPIKLEGVQVEVKGQEIHYKGPNHAGVHVLPLFMQALVENGALVLSLKKVERGQNSSWGLHRALIANALAGAHKNFERLIEINGLGFKVQLAGKKMTFSLGFSHKINVDLPDGVSLTVDKTGQKLTFASYDRERLGHVCAQVRSLRPPEPYKGTGVKFANETIFRKSGKAKSTAAGA